MSERDGHAYSAKKHLSGKATHQEFGRASLPCTKRVFSTELAGPCPQIAITWAESAKFILRGYSMNGWKRFFLTLCLLPCNAALGQTETPKYPLTVQQILDKNVRAAEQMVSAAAD